MVCSVEEEAVDSKFNRTPEQKILQIRKGNTAFMEQFDPYLHTVEKIYWAGGEPLLMDEHWYIMNKLVEMGRTDVRIFYNTNFSKLTYKDEDAVELWKKFKNVSRDLSRGRVEWLRCIRRLVHLTVCGGNSRSSTVSVVSQS